MKEMLSLLIRPFSQLSGPGEKAELLTANIVQALMFPGYQIMLSLSQKNLVNAFETGNHELLKWVYLFGGLIIVLILTVHPASAYFTERSTNRLMRGLRTRAASKLLFLPLSFFDKRHTGDIVMRVNTDLEAITRFYGSTLHFLQTSLFLGFGSITLMFFLSWPLAVVLLALASLETYVMARASERIATTTGLIQERLGKVNELFLDIVKSLRFIRMASISGILERKYRDTGRDVVDYTIGRNKTVLGMNALSDFLDAFNLVCVLGIGIVMYFNGYIDLGSVIAFLVLQDGVTYMFTNLRNVFQQARQYSVSFRRIFELLDTEDEQDIAESIGDVPALKHEDIEIKDVIFAYDDGRSMVLDNAFCTIPAGRITSLKGESGSGKSTLVKLLLGLYRLASGEIKTGDCTYTQLPLPVIREHFAYVPQSAYLFHDTIEQNIRAGNQNVSPEAVQQAAKLACAHDLIMRRPEAYRTLVTANGVNFSGGEKQRLALARAILKDAPVIILDEATRAIDASTEAQILKNIVKLREAGKTVIIVSHREIPVINIENTIVLQGDS